MVYVTYLGIFVWLVYYSIYEYTLHHTDKKVKERGQVVAPDLLVLSAIRYKCAWGAFIVSAILISVANFITPSYPLLYVIGVNLLEIMLLPIFIYIIFYFSAKYLISRAKKEKLKIKLNEKDTE